MRKLNIRWKDLITHEESRQHFQFVSVFILMAFISGFMTVMNYITGWRGALMHATLAFSLLNIINIFLEWRGSKTVQKIPRVLFAVEIVALFTFFIVNGQPKGFSTLWAALLPTSGLLLYKARTGSLISGIQFLIIVFLFYIPAGQELLRYEYTDVFMMRFPVLYAAFFLVGLFFELVRSYTQQELEATRDKYKQESLRIMQVLVDEYDAVVSVDIESGKMDIYSGKGFIPSLRPDMSFYDSMALFCDNMVAPKSRSLLKVFFLKENIREILKYDSSATMTFTADINGTEQLYQAKVVKIPEKTGQIKQVIAAFSAA